MDSTNITKCQFYNIGYCKNKYKCIYLHPDSDCDQTECELTTCMKCHRIDCRNGIECYYYGTGECEFRHDRMNENSNVQISYKSEYFRLLETIEKQNTTINDLNNKFTDLNDKIRKLNNIIIEKDIIIKDNQTKIDISEIEEPDIMNSINELTNIEENDSKESFNLSVCQLCQFAIQNLNEFSIHLKDLHVKYAIIKVQMTMKYNHTWP